MRRVRVRAPRAILVFSLSLLLALCAAWAAAACSDDPPTAAEVQSQPQQSDAAAQQEQTEPIDAGQQEGGGAAQQTQPAAAEQPSQQQTPPQDQQTGQSQQDQPAQDAAEPDTETQPEDESQPAPADPDRDTLIAGERFAAALGPDETERVFRFEASTGAWLRIFVDGKGGMDPIVTLLDPEGVEVAVNDDLSTANRDSLLVAQVTAEGLQFIRVQPFDSNSIGDFIIQVETLTLGADDDSAVISLGASVDGRLNSPVDVDVFEFRAEAGQNVFVLVDGDTGVDVYAQLFAPDGNLLLIDDDGGHGLDAELYFTADSAGLWRVEVWPASNQAGQRQLLGAYRVSVGTGLPISAVDEAVGADLAAAALTFLQAMRDGDALTILALAGPEALTIWGWDDADDVSRDLRKLQSIGLGGEILQTVSFGDVLSTTRGRVYFQLSEDDWLRIELIQLGGRWLVDDWAHSIGPPA